MTTTMFNLLSAEGAVRFGWTLLHSLWQSMAISLFVLICLRFIPANRSQLRYAVACGGLLLVVMASCLTFLLLGEGAAPIQISGAPPSQSFFFQDDTTLDGATALRLSALIDQYMPWVLTAWITGFLLFAVRFAAGLLYNHRVLSTAIPLENEWTLYITETARKLGIRRLILLAESRAVSAPVVIGYLKPVILIPVGMLTGLSPEQLQTIFLHELAHVKRYDYLINVLQSTVEVVFFFNPFVWALSGRIREEREYCCDDLVVRQHGNTRAYAHALTQLAETSLSSPGLAVSLTGDNNQLLNRIKRIMEKSVKNNFVSKRLIVPAVLLLAGLFFISWLGVQQQQPDTLADSRDVTNDTAREKKDNSARYARKSIITLDENGKAREEVIEEFEGDERLRPLLNDLAPLPDAPSLTPPPFPGPSLADTIPPAPFDLRMDEFSRIFGEEFGEDLAEMLTRKEADVAALMREFEEKFRSEEWVRQFEFNFPQRTFDSLERTFDSLDHFFDENTLRRLEEEIRHLHDLNLERVNGWRDHFDGDRYEDVLQKQLRKDGYLSEDETINSLEWNDETLKVNGKEIKAADEEKYREINRRYFNRRPLGKVE